MLDTEKIGGSIEDGFKQNSGSEMGALQARLDTLRGMLPSVKEGDLVTIGWIPARGTVVWFNGTEKGVIPGRDFADALFKVWFGDDPVQTSLMEGMLGE